MVVAPTTPRVTVRWRHIRAISPPWNGGRANEEDRSLRKKPWVSSLGGALLVLFSPRGEKSTQMPQKSKENGGGIPQRNLCRPRPTGNGRTAAVLARQPPLQDNKEQKVHERLKRTTFRLHFYPSSIKFSKKSPVHEKFTHSKIPHQTPHFHNDDISTP